MTFCPYCGTQQYDDAAFCHSCGKQPGTSSVAQPVAAALNVAVAAAPAPEATFYNDGGITVTNTRFIVPGQTYAVANITSVKLVKTEQSHSGAGWCIFFGLFLSLLIFNADLRALGLLGIFLMVIGVAWWRSIKPDYAVALHTAGGEQQAVTSKDESYIRGIVEALNKAIVYRN